MKAALMVACVLGSIAMAQAAPVKNTDPLKEAMPGASQDACVFISNISNWRVLDSRNVVIFAPNAKRSYLMQLASPISDLKFAFQVAFIDRDHNGMVCGRSVDRLVASDSVVRQPTIIRGVTRLNDAGLEALEAQYGVKLTRGKKEEETTAAETAQADESPVS